MRVDGIRRSKAVDFLTVGVTLSVLCLAVARWQGWLEHDSRGQLEMPERIERWRDYAQGWVMGPESATVTVVEFGDFQCPFCRAAVADLKAVRAMYPEEVSVVFRHFPLSSHASARDAAIAAECAGTQGMFEPMHDVLFAELTQISQLPWSWFAARAGVEDTVAFASCLRSQAPSESVEMDVSAGRELGIYGTPTFLINDRLVEGYPGREMLEAYVKFALEEAETNR